MSLLDTLKGLISNVFSSTPSPDQESLNSESIENPVVSAAEVKQEPKQASQVESKPAPVKTVAKVANKPVSEKVSGLKTPEDSTLKRHYISILKSEIESKLPPRPTDSTLRRHYETRVETELESLLAS
ncbi:MAG: hypothetical protein V3U87_08010 [Methylococcaceae bacterium]